MAQPKKFDSMRRPLRSGLPVVQRKQIEAPTDAREKLDFKHVIVGRQWVLPLKAEGQGTIQRAKSILSVNLRSIIQRKTAIVAVDRQFDASIQGHVKRLSASNHGATIIDIDSSELNPLGRHQLEGVDKLYFVAHGYGDSIGGFWTPKEVQDLLLTEETKKAWQIKELILVACNAANPQLAANDQRTFAEQLHEGLASQVDARLQTPFKLVGLNGYGYTDVQGRLRVVPYHQQKEYMQKVKALDALKTNPKEYIKQAQLLIDEYAPVGSGIRVFQNEVQDESSTLLPQSQVYSDDEAVSSGCWPFWPFTKCFSK